MRYTNPQLVAKCEQILCMISYEFDERAAKPKFVSKPDPLSSIRNNKLISQGEKLEFGISQVESFCIEYIVAAFKVIPQYCITHPYCV